MSQPNYKTAPLIILAVAILFAFIQFRQGFLPILFFGGVGLAFLYGYMTRYSYEMAKHDEAQPPGSEDRMIEHEEGL